MKTPNEDTKIHLHGYTMTVKTMRTYSEFLHNISWKNTVSKILVGFLLLLPFYLIWLKSAVKTA